MLGAEPGPGRALGRAAQVRLAQVRQVRPAQVGLAQVGLGVALEVGPVAMIPQMQCRRRECPGIGPDSRRAATWGPRDAVNVAIRNSPKAGGCLGP